MMKKILCAVLCLMMVLSLAACGKTAETQSVDLAKVCEEAVATLDSSEAPLFPETSEDMLYSLYPDLQGITLKQWVLYAHPVTGAPCEVLMVEVGSADVDAAKAAIQSRVDTAANDTFYTDNAEGWKNNAKVSVSGNYVVMAVLPEGAEWPAAFEAQF